MAEELEARLICPVQVVEHEDDRIVGTCRFQQTHDCGIKEVALGVGVGGLGRWELPKPLTEGGHHFSELRTMGSYMRAQQLVLCMFGVMGECLGERAVRSTNLLVTASEEHRYAGLMTPSTELRYQRRLSLSRFARQEDNLSPFARRHALSCRIQDGELTIAADHADGRTV